MRLKWLLMLASIGSPEPYIPPLITLAGSWFDELVAHSPRSFAFNSSMSDVSSLARRPVPMVAIPCRARARVKVRRDQPIVAAASARVRALIRDLGLG